MVIRRNRKVEAVFHRYFTGRERVRGQIVRAYNKINNKQGKEFSLYEIEQKNGRTYRVASERFLDLEEGQDVELIANRYINTAITRRKTQIGEKTRTIETGWKKIKRIVSYKLT